MHTYNILQYNRQLSNGLRSNESDEHFRDTNISQSDCWLMLIKFASILDAQLNVWFHPNPMRECRVSWLWTHHRISALGCGLMRGYRLVGKLIHLRAPNTARIRHAAVHFPIQHEQTLCTTACNIIRDEKHVAYIYSLRPFGTRSVDLCGAVPTSR